MNESCKPQLSVSLDSTWSRAVLRVDAIRSDTLYQLGATWAEDDGREDITEALDRLAELAVGSPTAAELDAGIDALDDAGCSEHADVRIGLADAVRLRAELDAAIAKLSRFGTAAAKVVPHQRERGAA
jgi:hypothetical protein